MLRLYFNDISQEPLLVSDEEVALAKQMELGRNAQRQLKENGHDPDARAELNQFVEQGEVARRQFIRANTRLVASIAKQYTGLGLPLPDLIQAGNLGLINAIDRFDYRKGARLSTYTSWWIRQSIFRTLQQQRRTVRLPAHMVDRVRKLFKKRRSLEQEIGHRPTTAELAREMDLPPEKVRWLVRISQPTLSLEMPLGKENDSKLADFIEDERSPSPTQRVEEQLLREEIEKALQTLSSRESRVLRLRFGLQGDPPLSLKEVGEKMGVSRERVRQIQIRALRKLRRPSLWRKLKGWLG
jgi:RNA polymerase primary sigma factor